jgi:RHS repeat-associated protein
MFQGREWIPELGIYDYRHRMYQPDLGLFLQMDPMGLDAGDMNLFRYCGDDPVDRSDPTGLLTRNWQAAMEAIDQGGLTAFFQAEAEAEAQSLTMARVSPIMGTASAATAAQKGEASTLRQYSDWRDAADSWREKTMSLVKRYNTEFGGEMAQKNDDAKISIATSPHPGPGVGPVDDGIQRGSFQRFTPNKSRVPQGYHMTGFYYGHTHHDPRFFHYDAIRAQRAGWNAVLFLPARRDAMSQEPTSLYYDHRTKPPE